jgi:ABC-2 type transport system permease protein
MSGYLGLVFLLVIVGVSLFCAPAIASEFEERTALLMFPRPMKKTVFLIGKMLACYIVCGAVIILYYLCVMLISLIFAGFDFVIFGSLGLALLFMLGAGGFAFFLSAVAKKGTVAIIMSIAALLMVFNMVDGILAIYDIEPVFSLTYAGLDISNIIDKLPTVRGVDVPGAGITMSTFYPRHTLAIGIMGTWFAVTSVLSAILFRRREF